MTPPRERSGHPTGDPKMLPEPGRRTRSGPARVTVSSPGDLLGLVPYLLGFRPSESLVLMLIREGRVLLTARVDLPPAAMADDVSQQFARLAEQHGASGLVLVGYSSQNDLTLMLQMLIEGLAPYGVVDALFVDDHRWWSLVCTGECCPAEGTAYELESHPMAAEAVYAGLTAAADRTVIENAVRGPSASELRVLSQLGESVADELRDLPTRQRSMLLSTMVLDFTAAPRRLGDEDCARFAALAADVTVRDVAWAAMNRADVEDHIDLWSQVVARTVSPWEAAPLCLLGMAAWISGNGALQNCCTDRALAIEPTYTMARLLAEINRRALPPQLWDALAADLRAAEQPLVG